MKRIFLIIVFFICFDCIFAYGQDQTLKNSGLTVIVKDVDSNAPIEMASVYLVTANDTLVKTFTFSDKKGVASLKNVESGKYLLNVQLLGFNPHIEELTLEARTIRSVSVFLKENLEELQGASITEMGDLITIQGDTLIYNATSYHTASNSNLGDLLKKMPGMELSNGHIKVNGEPVKRITVEGKTFFFDDQSKALENLPAAIVKQIHVIDENNQGKFGLSGKKMDVRLKDEFKEAWFGKVSTDGGISIDNDTKNNTNRIGGLYNAKLYAQFYGKDDVTNILGGGNNVNINQLSKTSSGLSDIAFVGVNYNTSRIRGFDTSASTSYDFQNNDNRSESHRTSFMNSGEKMNIDRSLIDSDISHSTKANFSISTPRFESYLTEGFIVSGQFRYKNTKLSGGSSSTTKDSKGEKLNESKSHTNGLGNDYTANVSFKTKGFLDKEMKHHISFDGNVSYDGKRKNSNKTSFACFTSGTEEKGILYKDRTDAIQLNACIDYNVNLSDKWELHSAASAIFYSSKIKRDAKNTDDGSTDDYYSLHSTDQKLNIKQTVYTSYRTGLERKRFDIRFGCSIYEDGLTHFSNTFGGLGNRSKLWQMSAGPEFNINFKEGNWTCLLYTNGKSISSSNGAARSIILDISNPVDISTGNIYLKTAYHQDLRLIITRGARRAGSSFIDMRLTGAIDFKEQTKASWYDEAAIRYSLPVNSKRPRYKANLDITYIQPLNKKRSLNLTITPKVLFGAGTIYIANGILKGIDKDKFNYSEFMTWFYGDSNGSEFYSGKSGFIENRTQNLNWSVNADLKYELKTCSISTGIAVNNNYSKYSTTPQTVNTWQYSTYAEVLWQNKSGWEAEGRFEFDGYCGFSTGFNTPDWLLNLKVAKTIRSFTISLSAHDILGSSKFFNHTVSAEYIEDTYRNNIGRCILIGLSYNFGKWNFSRKLKMKSFEKANNL